MIDLPIGKALVAVEVDRNKIDTRCRCNELCEIKTGNWGSCVSVGCSPDDRKDGKDVVFKLVDYKVEP